MFAPRPVRVLLVAATLAAATLAVSAESATAGNGSVTITRSNVTISNLHVTSSGTFGVKVTGKNVTLKNVTVTMRSGGAAITDQGQGTHIDGATLSGEGDGIKLGPNGHYNNLRIAMRQHLKQHTDAVQMDKGKGAGSTVYITNSILDAGIDHGRSGNACLIFETNGRDTGNFVLDHVTCYPGNHGVTAKVSKGSGHLGHVTITNSVFNVQKSRYAKKSARLPITGVPHLTVRNVKLVH